MMHGFSEYQVPSLDNPLELSIFAGTFHFLLLILSYRTNIHNFANLFAFRQILITNLFYFILFLFY